MEIPAFVITAVAAIIGLFASAFLVLEVFFQMG